MGLISNLKLRALSNVHDIEPAQGSTATKMLASSEDSPGGSWVKKQLARLNREAKAVTSGPLIRNAASLYGVTIVTSALGFIYWLVAARMVPASSVGIAFAVQSAAQLLAFFCVLGLSTLLIGELSSDRRHARVLILTAVVVAGLSAVIFSTFAGIIIKFFSKALREGITGSVGLPLFIVLTALTTILLLLDDSCIGLLRGDLQLRRNTVFAVSKLLLLPAMIVIWPDHSGQELVMAWTMGLGISLVTLTQRLAVLTRGQSSRLDFGRVLEKRYLLVGHHSLNISVEAPRLLLPIIVVIILGPVVGAAYTTSMYVVTFVTIIPVHLSTVLFALAPGDEKALRREARKTMRISLILALASAPFFLLFSGFILGVFGPSYKIAGTAMAILGLTTYPSAVKFHYVAISRVRGQMTRASLLTLIGSCLEVGFAVVGGIWIGIDGVALGYLAAILIEAALFAPVVTAVLRNGKVPSAEEVIRRSGIPGPIPVPEIDMGASGTSNYRAADWNGRAL